jgi:membrane protein
MPQDKPLNRLTEIYEKADRHSGGILGIIRRTAEGFISERGAEAAASIAYYAVFSMIPLLLLLISVLGFVLNNQVALDQVLNLISSIFPYARQPVENLLNSVVASRTSTGIIGMIALIFGAAGVFLGLIRNINRAWSSAHPLNPVLTYLISLGTIGLIALLLIGWVIMSAVTKLLFQQNLLGLQNFAFLGSNTWRLAENLVWLFVFILFLLMYHWVPKAHVRWAEAFWGALVVTLALLIVSKAFSWFLGSSFATYETLYGALGTGLAILTWVYISSIIILIGAHLSAAIARSRRPGDFQIEETT